MYTWALCDCCGHAAWCVWRAGGVPTWMCEDCIRQERENVMDNTRVDV